MCYICIKIKMMKKFSDLVEPNEDGIVPALEIFDIAFKQIYDKELDPMISCELHDDRVVVIVYDEYDIEYRLDILKNWSVFLWCGPKPLHFNQSEVYQKLIEWNFLSVNDKNTTSEKLMDSSPSATILPCPFCGEEAHFSCIKYTLKCYSCGISMHQTSMEKLIEKWNNRK